MLLIYSIKKYLDANSVCNFPHLSFNYLYNYNHIMYWFEYTVNKNNHLILEQ